MSLYTAIETLSKNGEIDDIIKHSFDSQYALEFHRKHMTEWISEDTTYLLESGNTSNWFVEIVYSDGQTIKGNLDL
jgi:hypothetical protein